VARVGHVSPVAAGSAAARPAQEWASGRRALTAIRALDENSGRLAPTLCFTDDADLGKIARQILAIYDGVVAAGCGRIARAIRFGTQPTNSRPNRTLVPSPLAGEG
jgi:hypothetical protein